MTTHLPLVQALSRSQQHQVKAGRVLFHGCVDTSQDTDLQGQRLLGSRKWLSEDAEYAVSYAYCNGAGGMPPPMGPLLRAIASSRRRSYGS